LKFYREWMATRPADSGSEVEAVAAAAAAAAALATPPKKVKAKPAAAAAATPPPAPPAVAPGAPKKKGGKKAATVVAGAPYKGTWNHEGVDYDRDDCAIYSQDGEWVGLYNPVTNTIDRDAEEPERNWS